MQSIREKFIMFFLLFFLITTPSLAMIAWYDTPSAYAGVGSFVSQGLSGSYSVSTGQGPGTYHTQGENIYSLGYSELRFNTAGQNLQLFTISPPNFSIGCSGIDATFGAFAMLGQHLMSMLQSIIQSGEVLVFAFNMVLGVLCKQCEHIMNQIEAIANKLNGLNFNSCQAAEAAGNIAGAEIGSMSAVQQAAGATNAFADSINSDLTSVSSTISGYVNTINTVMNCGSTQQGAQNLVANGFTSCGAAAAASKYLFGSLLRASLAQAHIGLVGSTTPGSGGVNDLIAVLRGTFTGDIVGYQDATKSGVPVVRFIGPKPANMPNSNQVENSAEAFDALMYGGSLNYLAIGAVQPAQPTTLQALEISLNTSSSETCFPGFMYYYQSYLNQVMSAYFPGGVLDTPTSKCGSIPASEQPAALSTQQLDSFVTNSQLPVILIGKLAYANQDPTLVDEAAKAMALGFLHNLFMTMLHGASMSLMDAKNLDKKHKDKLLSLFAARVDTVIGFVNTDYQNSLKSIKTQQDSLAYYQNINKQWVSTLSQYGLSGAYNFNP